MGLNVAVDALDEIKAADLLLTILRSDMEVILARCIDLHRQQVVNAFENWWNKYRVTLTAIGTERDATASSLQHFMRELGYVR
ncbi:hypothetical protein [Janthinobacterium lividum]|uniref:hypothetical protein n=1 Tax=Janthinobacterium lividum TaxID=29581 RepID=UPI001CB8C1BA|nr:hypothetical protein [Janthinobacterium lividum]